jgi:hypothetical protein
MPAGKAPSSGVCNLFLHCEEGSSGVGLNQAVMPLYNEGFPIPSGSLNLFLEAETQAGLWGYSLNSNWPSYNEETWSNWPSGSHKASGFSYSNLELSVSGERVIEKYAVMPLYERTSATGSSSGFMNLYVKNQEVSTGNLNLFSKAHEKIQATNSLYTQGMRPISSGSLNLLSSGLGYDTGTTTLYIRGFPT